MITLELSTEEAGVLKAALWEMLDQSEELSVRQHNLISNMYERLLEAL